VGGEKASGEAAKPTDILHGSVNPSKIMRRAVFELRVSHVDLLGLSHSSVPMPASSHKLAEALVSRLNNVVPPPFRLSAHSEVLHIYVGDALDTISSTLDIVEDETRDLTERLETAVHSVIDRLQDQISEHLGAPWPSLDGRRMAMPEVHSDGEWVHLWFGDRQAPVLSLPPIRIAEITGSGEENSFAT
jgi:hypothetical protein